MSNWIEKLESALNSQPVTGVEVLQGGPPPLLDAKGMQAIMSPILAAFVWGVEVFREALNTQPLDPLTLLLRLIALALTVRALILGKLFLSRLVVWLSYKKYQLALCDDGLIFRTPKCDIVVVREDVVGIRQEAYQLQQQSRHWCDVYLVTRPESGRLFLAIPPLFENTPNLLNERLLRWLGSTTKSHKHQKGEPTADVEALYDRIAAGERPQGVSVIPTGKIWLGRGPFATMLLGLAVLYGYIRIPLEDWNSINSLAPLVLILTLVVVPFMWFWFTLRNLNPRKGIGLLLTPTEVIMRLRHGLIHLKWTDISGAEIVTRRVWSILQGINVSSTLLIKQKNQQELHYRDVFLRTPLEVVVCLIDAYRKGLI